MWGGAAIVSAQNAPEPARQRMPSAGLDTFIFDVPRIFQPGVGSLFWGALEFRSWRKSRSRRSDIDAGVYWGRQRSGPSRTKKDAFGRARTCGHRVKGTALYQLSYEGHSFRLRLVLP